jgi:hypothetical protein
MYIERVVARLTEAIRRKHLALATEWSYCDYLKRLRSHLPTEQKLERFLTDLATKDVAASTQNQAVNAEATKGTLLSFALQAGSPAGTAENSPPIYRWELWFS